MLYALPLALGLIGQTARDRPPAPLDVVAALETAVADAVAKAEPSVVAIARTKAEKGTGTTAIRGRNPEPLPATDEGNNLGLRFGGEPEEIVFDYGSGVVIGDEGQILTAYHVVPRAEADRRQGRRPEEIPGRDHRRRPAERPRGDRPARGARRPPAGSDADRAGRRRKAPQGILPARARQSLQRCPRGRPRLGWPGHPGQSPAAARPEQ